MFVDVILELLFFMLCFFILGEQLRLILQKLGDIFENLDVLQILVLDVI